MADTILHKAEGRGHANHGWLNSFHTFSFGSYYNPQAMNFGALRVLNDDTVSGGMGFGRHPHDNMEIISIPLEGDLEHKDSIGNTAIIRKGDIQAMSAGTGIYHSEQNAHENEQVKFLQIWIYPNQKNVEPRYDQLTLNLADRYNRLQQILSPNPDDEGIWIYQNAWFHMGKFDQGKSTKYELKDRAYNGVYTFVLNGEITVNGQKLNTRDGLGSWNIDALDITADTEAEFLLMELPMVF